MPRDVAVRSDTIHRALANATTWGEFRLLLPPGEWEVILQMLKSSEEYEQDDEPPVWEFASHKFNGYDDIPAASDGYYPPWLQQMMSRFVPLDVLERFGSEKCSVHNGAYWHIDSEHVDGIVARLTERGFTVECADHLHLY